MTDGIRKYLFDMKQACEDLLEFAEGRTLEEYRETKWLRSCFRAELITVGEALNQLLKIAPELNADISEPHRIIGCRHVLVHGYDRVSHDLLWVIGTKHVPVLLREIDHLLEAPAEPGE
jgi:uncharacterized protein with HEPN domain